MLQRNFILIMENRCTRHFEYCFTNMIRPALNLRIIYAHQPSCSSNDDIDNDFHDEDVVLLTKSCGKVFMHNSSIPALSLSDHLWHAITANSVDDDDYDCVGDDDNDDDDCAGDDDNDGDDCFGDDDDNNSDD